MDEQMEISDKFRNEMHIVVPLSQVSKQGNKGPFWISEEPRGWFVM